MKTKTPLFSVIIPTYERPEELRICLNAVARIDYPTVKFEVIVVDDGSKSPPEGMVSSYSDRLDIKLITQSNTGPGGARNTGAENAKGKFLVFTDDDCEPDPQWLKEYEKAFSKYPDNIIAGKIINALVKNLFSSTNQLLVDYLYAYHNSDPEDANFFNTSNISIPREAFIKLDGFDVHTIRDTAEDRDLCERWLLSGQKITYIDTSIVYHSHHLSLRSLWRQHFNYGRGAYYFHKACAIREQKKDKIKPKGFYINLIRYPYKRKFNRAFFITILLLLTQVSYVLGYVWERGLRTVNST